MTEPSEPRWHSSDLPRAGEAEVPVRAISAATLTHAQLLVQQITESILSHRPWEHLVIEAIVEAERRAEEYINASEAPTLLPGQADPFDLNIEPPDIRSLEEPSTPTTYSSVGEMNALDQEILFDLTSDLPKEP